MRDVAYRGGDYRDLDAVLGGARPCSGGRSSRLGLPLGLLRKPGVDQGARVQKYHKIDQNADQRRYERQGTQQHGGAEARQDNDNQLHDLPSRVNLED